MNRKGEGVILEMLITLFILWQIVILFSFWGVKPEGTFEKIRQLDTQLQIQSLQNEEIEWRLKAVENKFNESLGNQNKKLSFKR